MNWRSGSKVSGKEYRLGGPAGAVCHAAGPGSTGGIRSLQGVAPAAASAPSTDPPFWALKDVSFEVQPGEVVGIIGRNGAGKSTLLKILSRITEPTEGEVDIDGRVGSLLEVGTGFHPELTGRENVYLNGAILGMRRAEITRKFDEIVAFAEVEKFIDTPVKHYSSGMYMRLAFAVAAHLEPEILIVDEVLAVGDAEFQKRCLGKMSEVAKGGRTVLFVSHNIGLVLALCDSGLYLKGGRVAAGGSMAAVFAAYSAEMKQFDGRAGELRPGAVKCQVEIAGRVASLRRRTDDRIRPAKSAHGPGRVRRDATGRGVHDICCGLPLQPRVPVYDDDVRRQPGEHAQAAVGARTLPRPSSVAGRDASRGGLLAENRRDYSLLGSTRRVPSRRTVHASRDQEPDGPERRASGWRLRPGLALGNQVVNSRTTCSPVSRQGGHPGSVREIGLLTMTDSEHSTVWIDGQVFENRYQVGIWRTFYEVLRRAPEDVRFVLWLRNRPVQPIPPTVRVVRDGGRIAARDWDLVTRSRRKLSRLRVPRGLRCAGVFHAPYFAKCPTPEPAMVTTIYDMIAEDQSTIQDCWAHDVTRKRDAILRASRIIAISEATRAELLRFYPQVKDRVRVVPLGADHLLDPDARGNELPGAIATYDMRSLSVTGQTTRISGSCSTRSRSRPGLAAYGCTSSDHRSPSPRRRGSNVISLATEFENSAD